MNKICKGNLIPRINTQSNLGRAMKLTSIALFVFTTGVCASVHSQNMRVNIHLNNTKTQTVLEEIEKQTDYLFIYNTKEVDLNREVSISAQDETVSKVLSAIFDGTNISYAMEGSNIMLMEKPLSESAPQQDTRQITGTVVDAAGVPVIGANVMVKGTTNGTITDIDGKFTLDVPEGVILQISYIGYMDQTVSVGEQKVFKIALKEDTQKLDEVVVVGYGTQKKVNLTGSVSSVKFDEEMANRPITDASQALSGKVSGVWISQNSGKPGDDGAQLRIRGWGTLNNSDPLVIIDGVEGSFSQINPSDIESISVLKDAASAAIYGSKAANGVVLVTTKMGKNNEKAQVELNSYVGFQQLGRHYDLVTNSAEHMTMVNSALKNNGSSPLFPESMISAFSKGDDSYKYPNTDWYDEIFRKAFITGHNLSIKGGTDKLSTFLSLNYLNQDGIIKNTKSSRYGIRSNLEYKVNNRIRIGGKISYNRSISSEPYSLQRVIDMLCGSTPFIAPYTKEGDFGSVQAIADDGTLLYVNHNPLIEMYNGETSTVKDYLSLNSYAIFDLIEGLSLNINFSSNNFWKNIDQYNETIYGYTDTGIETMNKNYNRDGIVLSRDQSFSVRNNFQSSLNYSKKLFDRHFISGIIGMQLENYSVKNIYARRTSPPKEGLTQVDAGTEGIQNQGNYQGLRMFSYFGRLNYSFADKYLFEVNMRADASSRFKRGNRWGIFPGFSAGWRLSEEPFVKNLNLFSNLKLRASWGQLGNQTISGYWPYLTIIEQNYNSSYNFGGELFPGAAVTTLVDDDITWETTSSLDIGLDIGLLGNKLNVELDYFNKITRDILVQLPISNIVGDKIAPFENIGEMKNNGFELVLNYDNLQNDRDHFGFNVNLNLTYIDNYVSKFQGGKSPDQLYLIREGYPYKSLYGYKAIGIYKTNEEALEHMKNNGFIPQMGNLKYEDVNDDGKLDYQDKQYLGNTIPKITYGISSGVRYKGFDLNLLFQGVGLSNAMTQNTFTEVRYENMSLASFWRDAWSESNSDSNIPMLQFDSSWNQYDSSFWMHRIDFLKLKNIQIGYLFNQSFVEELGLSRLYLYFNAQNLFSIVWDKDYVGYDPERSGFDSGKDVYPLSRIFTFGMNINF